jgi:putative methyltransferase (TIGR04325 family)
MKIPLKEFIKLLAPPLLVQGYRVLRGRLGNNSYGLSGNYRSWDEAVRNSTGYDSEIILEKTKTALLKVKNGEAVHERDSVLFDEIQYAWPLLAGLMWVAAQAKGRLNVLDFGGSLGSTYFQNRAFLHSLPDVRWNIVEQPKYVDVGKKWFEDEHLKFYPHINDCLAHAQPNMVVLSGVLQYLERPYDKLRELLELHCDHIIIDRTPFWDGLTDMLCVQNVPPSIYPASYPSWIFSTSRFHAYLKETWQIMTEFDSFDSLKAPVRAIWQGVILERRKCVKSQM